MAFCQKCGQKIESRANYCPVCGSPVGIDYRQRQQFYEGSIHKCPNCGDTVKSFVSVCPTCGFEFRDTNSSNAVKVFANKLEQLQSQKKAPSTISNVAKVYGFGTTDITEEQILNLIRNFSVPNTKEDVFEFMILASSNINVSAISGEAGINSIIDLNTIKSRNDAWQAKMEQVYQKARIAFGSDADFYIIHDLYSKTLDNITKAKNRKAKRIFILFLLSFSFFAFLLIALFILVAKK